MLRAQFYWPHFHYFFFYTIAYIIGIIYCFSQFNQWIAVTLTVMIINIYLLNEDTFTYKRIIYFIFFLSLGVFRFYKQNYDYHNSIKDLSNQNLSLVITITDINQIYQSRNKYKINATINSTFTVPQTDERQVIIYTQDKPLCLVGDTLLLQNVKFKPIENESLKNYLIKEDVVGNQFYKTIPFILIYRPRHSFIRKLHEIRESLINELRAKMTLPTFSYFSCLFLGNKKVSKTNERLKEYCKFWGILHYLARSGLHLVLFAISVDLILGIIPITFFLKNLLMIFIFLLYFLLTSSSISFMRSLLMLCLYKICFCFNGQIHVIHTLTLVTFFILWFNPLQLFFLDFQLSFGITFLLAFFNQIQHQKKRQMA